MIVRWFREGRTDPKQLAMRSAVLTALTITGAVVFIFEGVVNLPTHALEDLSLWLVVPIGVLILSLSFVAGGGIWGWGMASLFEHPRWPAARTGARSIAGMFLLLEVPVHFSQALSMPIWWPFGIHGMFALVFAIEIFLVAGVASARLAKRLGVDEGRRSLGTRVGLAGAAGTVVGSLLALAVGFEVGAPPASNMVWALYVVVAVGGFAAGGTLGWTLAHHAPQPVQEPTLTSPVGT